MTQLALSMSMIQNSIVLSRYQERLGKRAHLVEKCEQIRMHHVESTESLSLRDHARDANLTRAYTCISTGS